MSKRWIFLLFMFSGTLKAQHQIHIPEIKAFKTSGFSRQSFWYTEENHEDRLIPMRIKTPLASELLKRQLFRKSFGLFIPLEPTVVLILDPIDKAIYGETISLYI